MPRYLAVLAVSAFALIAPAASSAALPHFDLRGVWHGVSVNGTYSGTSTYNSMNLDTGAYAGTGAGGGYTSPFHGVLDGSTATTEDGPYDQLPSYTSHEVGTISPDGNRIDGTFHDSNGTDGDFHGARNDARRPISTAYICKNTVPSPTDTCTVTVRDLGGASPTTPTGRVNFETGAGGTFTSGQGCDLTPTPSSTGVASCHVEFQPASGTQPKLTAYYVGDTGHNAGNSGQSGTQHASRTDVSCTYVIASQKDVCTATVNDTSAASRTTPTGAVGFSSSNGGVFPSGSSCTLSPTATVGVARCTVDFIPPAVGNPTITGRYGGDLGHSASAGTSPAVVARFGQLHFVSSLGVTPSTFVAAPSGASTARRPLKHGHAKRDTFGTVVSYRVRTASRVRFTAQRKTAGRKGSHGRCDKPSSKNRTHRACTRYVPVRGSFTLTASKGSHHFRFRGRIGGRALSPGRYRLAATPYVGHSHGRPTYTAFTIKRR
jgi:hypothetical protein